MAEKKYGLLLPELKKANKPIFKASHNVFGEDSDSDEMSNKKPAHLQSSNSKIREAKASREKAVLEDPTVFQYDEIYDSMTQKKEQKKTESRQDKKPKYIENLMKSASKRKIENERRIERQIQKDRENEGEEFADKEIFVTSAYKKKLEELRQEEEREKREEYLESIGDVTKQRDLGGFYRHLYEQKLGPEKDVEKEKNHNKEENVGLTQNQPQNQKDLNYKKEKPETKHRNYRKRKLSTKSNKSEGENAESDEEVNKINLTNIKAAKKSQTEQNIDADSDFLNSDNSSDSDSEQEGSLTPKLNTKEALVKKENIEVKTDEERSNLTKNEDKITIQTEMKPKIDIWKKRTVGEIYEQAVKRYYARKSARGW